MWPPFLNVDQKLAVILDELDRIKVQNSRNTHHILKVMFRMYQQTQTKLDKLLEQGTPALKAELKFGKPVDKPDPSSSAAGGGSAGKPDPSKADKLDPSKSDKPKPPDPTTLPHPPTSDFRGQPKGAKHG